MKMCINCQGELKGLQTKFCSGKCKSKYFQVNIRDKFKAESGLSYQSSKGLRRKLEIIDRLGGGCSKCGYERNIAALELHHEDPTIKGFSLDMRSISNMSILRLEVELRKCVVLCANCHREHHNPQLHIKDLRTKRQGVAVVS